MCLVGRWTLLDRTLDEKNKSVLDHISVAAYDGGLQVVEIRVLDEEMPHDDDDV